MNTRKKLCPRANNAASYAGCAGSSPLSELLAQAIVQCKSECDLRDMEWL